MKLSDWIWVYYFTCKLKIESLVDQYIFHTPWCSEHGYECHGNCMHEKYPAPLPLNENDDIQAISEAM